MLFLWVIPMLPSARADRIADGERAEADVAAVVPEHPFVIDDGSETRTAGAWLEHLDRQSLSEECAGSDRHAIEQSRLPLVRDRMEWSRDRRLAAPGAP